MIDKRLMEVAVGEIREAQEAAERGEWRIVVRRLEQASRQCTQVVAEIAVAALRGIIKKESK